MTCFLQYFSHELNPWAFVKGKIDNEGTSSYQGRGGRNESSAEVLEMMEYADCMWGNVSSKFSPDV